jgi:hypothetical protein
VPTPLRIGNCSGYFGDRGSAARELIEGGEIDVLTGDYLAETTMLILARQRMQDPSRGYASTFIDHMRDVLAACLDRGVKVIANAGGLHPDGCAAALRHVASEAGLNPKVAVVQGDNLLPDLDRIQADGWTFPRAGSGAPLAELGAPIVAANAYLGAWGIVEALRAGADVVITGRVTDSALALAPAVWRFGWELDDWDRMAAGIIAGHLIECSTQVTGGNYAFFDEVEILADMGMPIVEMEASGDFTVTKHPNTGGAVTTETVLAQLVYEIGSPAYLTPDVTAHFDSVRLQPDGEDRVRVSGAKGSPPPETLKAIVHYPAGFRNAVDVIIGGGDIERKVDAFERLFWERAGGKDAYLEVRSDRFLDAQRRCLVRLAARGLDRERVGRMFSNAAVELVLASVPGITLASPPRDARGCGGIWSTTVPRTMVRTTVDVDRGRTGSVSGSVPGSGSVPVSGSVPASVPLGELCGARSGDKGGDANVAFWVRDSRHYRWLLATVTEKWLRTHLPEPFDGAIERYELPNVHAVNFLLRGYLGEGAAASILLDPQAKFLGEQLRDVVVSGP